MPRTQSYSRIGWIGALCLCLLMLVSGFPSSSWATPIPQGSELTGRALGEDWRTAPEDQKQAYCQKAYRSFRGSPSQSYIISSNVQAITPEGICKRLDQFYSFDINEDTPLSSASGIAPLIFSDLPLQ